MWAMKDSAYFIGNVITKLCPIISKFDQQEHMHAKKTPPKLPWSLLFLFP